MAAGNSSNTDTEEHSRKRAQEPPEQLLADKQPPADMLSTR